VADPKRVDISPRSFSSCSTNAELLSDSAAPMTTACMCVCVWASCAHCCCYTPEHLELQNRALGASCKAPSPSPPHTTCRAQSCPPTPRPLPTPRPHLVHGADGHQLSGRPRQDLQDLGDQAVARGQRGRGKQERRDHHLQRAQTERVLGQRLRGAVGLCMQGGGALPQLLPPAAACAGTAPAAASRCRALGHWCAGALAEGTYRNLQP